MAAEFMDERRDVIESPLLLEIDEGDIVGGHKGGIGSCPADRTVRDDAELIFHQIVIGFHHVGRNLPHIFLDIFPALFQLVLAVEGGLQAQPLRIGKAAVKVL